MNTERRTRLLRQCLVLLDRTAVKVDLTPLATTLDVDFLEHVLLFVGAVRDELCEDEASDTIPAGELPCTCVDVPTLDRTITALGCPKHDACGRCGTPRVSCVCA